MINDEPTYISGDDIPVGTEVKWYHGGVARSEERTVSAAEVTAGALTLQHPAEYGSLVGTVNGAVTLFRQLAADGLPATDSTGTAAVQYLGMTIGDTVSLDYIDTTTVPLTHIATGTGVSTTVMVDAVEEAVDARLYKHRRTGAAARVATLEELWYSDALLAAFFGDLIVSETDGALWTDEYQTTKVVPVIVGKWYSDGVLRKKYFLLHAEATTVGQTLGTETYYANRFDLQVENLRVYTLAEEHEMTIDIANVTISGAKSWNGQRIYDVTIEGDVKQIAAGSAGEDLNAYDCVYLETNRRYYKTKADIDARCDGILAIVLGTVPNGGDGQFQLRGAVDSVRWAWVPGRPVYLAAKGGELTQTAPTAPGSQIRVVGYATTSTTLMFDPDSTVLEV